MTGPAGQVIIVEVSEQVRRFSYFFCRFLLVGFCTKSIAKLRRLNEPFEVVAGQPYFFHCISWESFQALCKFWVQTLKEWFSFELNVHNELWVVLASWTSSPKKITIFSWKFDVKGHTEVQYRLDRQRSHCMLCFESDSRCHTSAVFAPVCFHVRILAKITLSGSRWWPVGPRQSNLRSWILPAKAGRI